MRAILHLVRKEYLQIFRDRPSVIQIFFIPVIQLVVLANAATFEVSRAPMHVVDLDRTQTSRGLVERMVASDRFTVSGRSASMRVGDDALMRRDATVVLRIPAGFERDLVRTGLAPVQIMVNAEEGAAAGIVQSYAVRIIERYAREIGGRLRPSARVGAATAASGAAASGAAASGAIDVRVRGWYNPTLDYKHYMVPGILVSLTTLIGMLLTAQNIAREKELGTLEQLNVTPITKGQFIAGKLIPFWILALVIFAIGLIVGRFAFGIPMRGSLPLVFLATAVYLVVALGIGLWISTITQTQQQTMFVSFFIMMVYLLLSGLFTPLESMPAWARWIAEVNPVKHFVLIMRGVLVRGAGLREIALPLGILAVYGAVVLAGAVRQYSKTNA